MLGDDATSLSSLCKYWQTGETLQSGSSSIAGEGLHVNAVVAKVKPKHGSSSRKGADQDAEAIVKAKPQTCKQQ